MTASAIYEGIVRHRRFAVRPRQFRHRLSLAYIDLDELPSLLGGRLVASGPGLTRFRRRHYLGDSRVPLSDEVRRTVAQYAGVPPRGPIRVLANLSTLGHCFNPVSFYYCLDDPGERVEAVVAEVTNTPWGERHAYVLVPETVGACGSAPPGGEGVLTGDTLPGGRAVPNGSIFPGGARVLAGSSAKALHVSPFLAMDHRYEWRITVPAETLSVHIASSREGRPVFDATLSLCRRELTAGSLARLTARYPASAMRTLILIYAQAARLKLSGVPVYPHPKGGVT